MQAIHQTFEQAPASIPIPEQWRHKRVEVILLVQEESPVFVGMAPLLKEEKGTEKLETRVAPVRDLSFVESLWES
ncbi:MAG: hypothetical protein G8345_15515 [Magnetococcales bacterium]|nr:hypothetical protein [Magnetococcales bacterium]NGZ28286.1 hypothetical protein [Magnetococcales bacterium]